MRRLVSLLVILVLVGSIVLVPSPPAEADVGDVALGLAAFAVGAIILNAIFAKPAPAAVIYPAPQVQAPAPAVAAAPSAPATQTVATLPGAYAHGGLMVANGTPFPFDVFVNNQLRQLGVAPNTAVHFPDVYGQGNLLARSPDGKFAEVRFYSNDSGAGTQVVLRQENFR